MPLVHNRIPGTMTPSYTSWFTLPYTRLPGFRDIERGDAVVFNYPPGDTAIVDPYYAGHNYYHLHTLKILVKSMILSRHHLIESFVKTLKNT